MALPLAAALAWHAMAAALLLATPPRHMPPAAEPLAVAVVTEATPSMASMPPTVTDLDEPALPGPVTWPDASPTTPPATPRPATSRPFRIAASPAAIPASPPSSAHSVPTADAVAAWRAALSDWIERHRRYPPAARLREDEGAVLLRFNLDPTGLVLHVVLERSSGSSTLDAAAIALLTGATLPSPPPGLPLDQRSVSLTIRYRLQ